MLLPWRKARRWACLRCGSCCYRFVVPLSLTDYIRLTRKYGGWIVVHGPDGWYLRQVNGRCVFLDPVSGLCAIHPEKPKNCMLFPFYVRTRPRYGLTDEEAVYWHGDRRLFVYLNSECRSIGRGMDIEALLPQVVRLWMSGRPVQYMRHAALITLRLDLLRRQPDGLRHTLRRVASLPLYPPQDQPGHLPSREKHAPEYRAHPW